MPLIDWLIVALLQWLGPLAHFLLREKHFLSHHQEQVFTDILYQTEDIFLSSISHLLRIFIMNVCWIFSNAFSVSVELSVYFFLLFFNVLNLLIGFCISTHSYIPGINSIWSWSIILFIYSWMKCPWGLLVFFLFTSFLFLLLFVKTFSGFSLRAMLASLNKLGRVPSFLNFERVCVSLVSFLPEEHFRPACLTSISG